MAFGHLETSLHRHHQRRILRRPEGRLGFVRIIRLLDTSISRLRPIRFFRCPGCRKWVCNAFRRLKSSLHRLHHSRILWPPESRLWVLRAIRLLKSSLPRFVQVAFYMPRMHKISSNGLSTPWNIASSNSLKSHLKTSRSQIMSSQGHSPNWNITSGLPAFRFFGCSGFRKLVRMDFSRLQTSLHRL
jgi:hypothetical protein